MSNTANAGNVHPKCRTLFEALCDIAQERALEPYEWRIMDTFGLKDWQRRAITAKLFGHP